MMCKAPRDCAFFQFRKAMLKFLSELLLFLITKRSTQKWREVLFGHDVLENRPNLRRKIHLSWSIVK